MSDEHIVQNFSPLSLDAAEAANSKKDLLPTRTVSRLIPEKKVQDVTALDIDLNEELFGVQLRQKLKVIVFIVPINS